MRIIADEMDPGHWMAWDEASPQNGYGGPTPQAAVARLCEAIGRHPNTFRPSKFSAHRFVLDELTGRRCPDCRGTGRYVGFTTIETCQRCQGSGRA
jgi:hypothetical protein